MRILITCFEPFGNNKINPSYEVVKALQNHHFKETIDYLLLPVKWNDAPIILKNKLNQNNYDYILLLGLAGNRKAISLEKRAVNLMDSSFQDEANEYRHNEVIDNKEGDFLYSTLPLDLIYHNLTKENIEVIYSLDAGKFICNLVLWTTLSFCLENKKNYKAGFIHLPNSQKRDDDTYYMDINTQIKAVKTIINTLITNENI